MTSTEDARGTGTAVGGHVDDGQGDAGGPVGVWFVGARGSVATTALVGLHALRSGLAGPVGLVSELPALSGARLPDLSRLVTGGHDPSPVPFRKRADELAAQRVVPQQLVDALGDALDAADEEVVAPRPAAGGGQAAEVAGLVADLRAFAGRHRVERLVVVDVSSTRPPLDPADARRAEDLATPEAVRAAWAAGRAPLPLSATYAWAAFEAGASFVAFTPSPGVDLPAVAEHGRRSGATWAGSDGKTGETLLKSVLAPMFVQRALHVDSWASFNLLGGGDGQTLADPEAVRSKTATKAAGLEAMVGRPVPGPLHIDNVPDHGDWKTAWDHVGFTGFLGTRMTLQFTWAGCDSALAAPLVLDLVRLVAAAADAGRTGAVPELGFFFKNPCGSDEHALGEQWRHLLGLAEELGRR
ncbi:inositol-3-phosphate synthase [Pseudokineococcus sp. 5B2Z-1]|uniref:inositol-3-phosphate synthase n=1 Tax=Pseudokineococcus sp. 5B2Z-1 TaxID=3132744 RepID=UPI0030B61C48